jgi:CRP-like cAMP-binding protein
MKQIFFMLGELFEQDLDWLLYAGRKEPLAAGTTLIQEGFPVNALYILLSGRLSVTIDAAGKELAQLTSGDIVGEISFLDSRPPLATVRAVEDSLVLEIPRQQIIHKLAADPAFAAHFYRAIALFLADRLRDTVSLLGYDEHCPPGLSLAFPHDLSPSVIDHLPLARQRLEKLLKRLRGF